MKILCETQVVNRQLMPQSTKNTNRSVKATLAIGFHPPGQKKNSELFLIHFTAQNKNGCRYRIKDNIEKVYTKFLNDGKATISFKLPEHNLLIKCDPLQLKCFLRTMKLALDGNQSELKKIGLKAVATATPIPQKSQPIVKCIIKNRSEYPIKGFPKTLKELSIIGLKCYKLDSQIINLKNLTKLMLSDNLLKIIPKEIGELGLIEFDLSSNQLGVDNCDKNALQQKWSWLDGKRLRKTLRILDLSNNMISSVEFE